MKGTVKLAHCYFLTRDFFIFLVVFLNWKNRHGLDWIFDGQDPLFVRIHKSVYGHLTRWMKYHDYSKQKRFVKLGWIRIAKVNMPLHLCNEIKPFQLYELRVKIWSSIFFNLFMMTSYQGNFSKTHSNFWKSLLRQVTKKKKMLRKAAYF